MASTEVERHTGVDVEEVPSAQWGWSTENHKLIHIGGLLVGGIPAADDARQPHRSRRGLLPDRVRGPHPRRGRARLVAAPSRLDPLDRVQGSKRFRAEVEQCLYRRDRVASDSRSTKRVSFEGPGRGAHLVLDRIDLRPSSAGHSSPQTMTSVTPRFTSRNTSVTDPRVGAEETGADRNRTAPRCGSHDRRELGVEIECRRSEDRERPGVIVVGLRPAR